MYMYVNLESCPAAMT